MWHGWVEVPGCEGTRAFPGGSKGHLGSSIAGLAEARRDPDDPCTDPWPEPGEERTGPGAASDRRKVGEAKGLPGLRLIFEWCAIRRLSSSSNSA